MLIYSIHSYLEESDLILEALIDGTLFHYISPNQGIEKYSNKH
jgi:hypothetical protein